MLRYLLIMCISTILSSYSLLYVHERILAFLHRPPARIVLAATPYLSVSSPKDVPSLLSVQSEESTSSALELRIKDALDGTKGTYAVVTRHMGTGETYRYQDKKPFQPGSLYKLWVMATVYEEIAEGNLSLDQTLSRSIATLNERFSLDPEEAEQTEGTITMTVSQALHQMITISHNYAAMLLTEKIRLSRVSRFLKDHGFEESAMGDLKKPPVTTASDMEKFFTMLYEGKLGNQTATEEMISLLKKQTLNHKIPKYLPEGVSVAHKTGELFGFSHDAGVITTPDGEYLLVLMSESALPGAAEERLADISRVVYEYFSQ